MTAARALALQRLANQRLIGPSCAGAEEVVGWLGAVQAQDYPLAKWSVGRRAAGATDASLDEMLNDGRILRTHILRPTWHFVLPADIRWLQSLVGPRVQARSRPRYLQLGLDASELASAHEAIARALEGGRRLTRRGIGRVLEQAGVALDIPRLTYIVMHAELELLICSGGLDGGQHTYALLDERVPPAVTMSREDALGELARRYFTSHGPSTVRDFTWWSSLTVTDARAAIDICGSALERTELDGLTYWSGADSGSPLTDARDAPNRPRACLLQAFDEFVVGYQATRTLGWDPNSFMHPIVLDGEPVGHWRRERKKDRLIVMVRLLRPLAWDEEEALATEAERYGAFMGLAAKIEQVT